MMTWTVVRMVDTAPIYVLATMLGESYGEHDPRSIEAVKVVHALLSDEVLAAIVSRTHFDTVTVQEHLVAMARLVTKESR